MHDAIDNIVADPVQAVSRDEPITIDCTIGRIHFRGEPEAERVAWDWDAGTFVRKPAGAWCAFAINTQGYLSANGKVPFRIEAGMRVRITGTPGEYNGRPQLTITKIEELPPAFHDAPKLALGRCGIGAAVAEKLEKELGSDAIEKINVEPGLVDQVLRRNKPETRAKVIAACQEIDEFGPDKRALYEAGISQETLPKVLEVWNPKRDPYALTAHGYLSFTAADALSRTPLRQGQHPFDCDDSSRIIGVLAQQMNDAARNGHTGVSCQRLEQVALKQHGFAEDLVGKAIAELTSFKAFSVAEETGKEFIWNRRLLGHERRIAAAVKELCATRAPHTPRLCASGQSADAERFALSGDDASGSPSFSAKQLEKFRVDIDEAGDEIEFALNAEQVNGVLNAKVLRLSIITGPPGSGKTACLRVLASMVPRYEIIGCSPTARGAERLQELTGIKAMTVHRLLDMKPGERPNHRVNLLGHRWLIVDESSMMAVALMAQLLDAAVRAKVEHGVLVGDADQLPPVEAGEPFRDLIDSSIIPVTRLERIYRTKEGGDIHELCNGIRKDESPVAITLDEDGVECLAKVADFPDIIFFPETENDAIAAIVCERYKELIEEGARPDEIMVLTPFNTREHIGSQPLNARIRNDVLGRTGPPVPGDLVYHTKNDKVRQVWNGNRGIVRGFRGNALGVIYGNREVLYSAQSLTKTFERGPAIDLMWSYAGSVHKAQGSEFKHVIVVIPEGCYGYLFGKAHLYTGCSRAQQSLAIIGDLKAIPDIIEAGRRSRVTALPYLLDPALRESATPPKDAGVGKVDWSSRGDEPIKLDEGVE